MVSRRACLWQTTVFAYAFTIAVRTLLHFTRTHQSEVKTWIYLQNRNESTKVRVGYGQNKSFCSLISNSHRTEEKLYNPSAAFVFFVFFPPSGRPNKNCPTQRDTQFSNLRSRWQTLCQWRYVLASIFLDVKTPTQQTYNFPDSNCAGWFIGIQIMAYGNPCVYLLKNPFTN